MSHTQDNNIYLKPIYSPDGTVTLQLPSSHFEEVLYACDILNKKRQDSRKLMAQRLNVKNPRKHKLNRLILIEHPTSLVTLVPVVPVVPGTDIPRLPTPPTAFIRTLSTKESGSSESSSDSSDSS